MTMSSQCCHNAYPDSHLHVRRLIQVLIGCQGVLGRYSKHHTLMLQMGLFRVWKWISKIEAGSGFAFRRVGLDWFAVK